MSASPWASSAQDTQPVALTVLTAPSNPNSTFFMDDEVFNYPANQSIRLVMDVLARKVGFPAFFPREPCRNYNVIAFGYDVAEDEYPTVWGPVDESCLPKGLDELVAAWERFSQKADHPMMCAGVLVIRRFLQTVKDRCHQARMISLVACVFVAGCSQMHVGPRGHCFAKCIESLVHCSQESWCKLQESEQSALCSCRGLLFARRGPRECRANTSIQLALSRARRGARGSLFTLH